MLAPIDTQGAGSPRWAAPVARRPFTQADNDTVKSASPVSGQPGRASQATPDTDLGKLITQLSRQLKTIEQTFIKALRSLARSVESAGSAAQPSIAGRTRSE